MNNTVEIILKAIDQATAPIKQVSSTLTSMASSAGSAAIGMSKQIGTGMMVGGAAITALGVTSMKSFGDLQASLNRAAVISGSTGKTIGTDMKELNDLASKLGAELPLAATDVANAMNRMAESGASLKDIKSMMPAIAQGATAAGESVEATASTVQSAMNIWANSLKSPQEATALLVQNANMSNAGVADMQTALANAGGVANQAGLSFQQTAGAIGFMTKSGIDTASAGTYMQRMLVDLTAPTKKAADAMSDLGIHVYDANGKMKPFGPMMQEVANAINGLGSEEEKNAAINDIFTTQGARGFNALAKAGKDGSLQIGDAMKYIEDIGKNGSKSLTDAGNAAAFLSDQASTMQQNMGSKIEQLSGNWESLRNKAMGSTTGITGGILDMANAMLNAGGNSDTLFGKLTQGFVGLTPVIGPAMVGIGGFLRNAQTIAPVLSRAAGGVGSLLTKFVGLPAPLMIAGAAVAGLGALFVASGGDISKMGDMISGGLQKVGQFIQSFVSSIAQNAPQIVTAVVGIFQSLIQGIQTNLPAILNAGMQIITMLIQGIATALPQIMETIGGLIPKIVTFLVSMLPQLIQTGLTLFLGLLNGLIQAIPQIIDGITTAIPVIIAALVAALPLLITGAIQLFLGLLQGFIEALPQLLDAIIGAIPQIVKVLIDATPQLLEAAILLFTTLVTALLRMIPQLLSNFGDMISGVLSAMDTFIADFAGKAAEWVSGMISKVGEMISGVVSGIGDMISQGLNSMGQFVSNMASKAIELAQGVINGIASLPGQAIGIIADFGAGLINGLNNLVGEAVNAAINLAKGIVNGIKSFLHIGSPSKVMDQIGNWTGMGLANGITDQYRNVEKATDGLAKNALMDPINNQATIGVDYKGVGNNNQNLSAAVSSSLAVTQQPAQINLNLGGTQMKAFVNNITNKQDRATALEIAYGI
jgi:TP901 family phage tail tape measure protein